MQQLNPLQLVQGLQHRYLAIFVRQTKVAAGIVYQSIDMWWVLSVLHALCYSNCMHNAYGRVISQRKEDIGDSECS